MRNTIILIFALFVISCKDSKTQNANVSITNEVVDNKTNSINLKFKNTSVIISRVNSVNDNVEGDFNIKSKGTRVLIQPSFLESDLLDGKELKFSNDAVKKIKITFSYDAIFYGEEKIKTMLGFKRDTAIVLKVNNKKVEIPSFEDIKKIVVKKFEKKEVYDVAYLVNQNYFNKIVENYKAYGGKDSPDYKSALAFLKSNKKSQKLEDLFINIDYLKFNIEFEDNSNLNSSIVFDRKFKKYDFSKKETSSNVDQVVPKGFYSLDSTIINLKNVEFKILTLEKDEMKDKLNPQHNSNPIVILEKKNNEYQKINENYNLVFKYDDNCPADGYGGIVSKNNYFTIQQIFCEDFLFVNSYTTFKIDEITGSITLHKYGEEFTDRSNPDRKIPNKVWAKKDFGEIKFDNVTEDLVLKIRKENPKK